MFAVMVCIDGEWTNVIRPGVLSNTQKAMLFDTPEEAYTEANRYNEAQVIRV